MSAAFVPIPIDVFDFTSVHYERSPKIGYTRRQIIRPNVNRQCIFAIQIQIFRLDFINIRDFEGSAVVQRNDFYLFDFLADETVGHANFYLVVVQNL